jgi:hypothetical protein
VVMYLYVRSTSHESEWSCICMLGVQSFPLSTVLLLCCVTVPTVWNLLFFTLLFVVVK